MNETTVSDLDEHILHECNNWMSKFLSLVEIRQKNAFLEGFTAFFKKCYEFLDFASFDSFKEVTSFASILLVFHRKSSRSYLWIQ